MADTSVAEAAPPLVAGAAAFPPYQDKGVFDTDKATALGDAFAEADPKEPVEYADIEDSTPAADSVEAEDASEQPSEETSDETTDAEQPETDKTDEAEASEPPEFGEELLAEASERLGLTAEQVEQFGTAENLEFVLAKQDHALAQIGQQMLDGQQPPQPPSQATPSQNGQAQQPPVQPMAQPPSPPANQEPSALVGEYKVELNADEHDELIVKTFNGLNEHVRGEFTKHIGYMQDMAQAIVDMQQQNQQITGNSKAEADREFDQTMNTFFAGLGDEFKDTFGREATSKLSENDGEFANRQKLVREMNALDAGYQQTGRAKLPRVDLASRALRALYPDKIKQTVRQELAAKVASRQRQTVSRPGTNRPKGKTGDERAIAIVEEFQRNAGAYDDSYPDEL